MNGLLKKEVKREIKEICAKALNDQLPFRVGTLFHGTYAVDVRGPVNDDMSVMVRLKHLRNANEDVLITVSTKETF